MKKTSGSGFNTQVPVPAKAPAKSKTQPITGKLGGGLESMPGSKGKGIAIDSVKSQKPTGKLGRGMTPMGDGIIKGMV